MGLPTVSSITCFNYTPCFNHYSISLMAVSWDIAFKLYLSCWSILLDKYSADSSIVVYLIRWCVYNRCRMLNRIFLSSSVNCLLSLNPRVASCYLYFTGHKQIEYTIGPSTGPLPASSIPPSYSHSSSTLHSSITFSLLFIHSFYFPVFIYLLFT